MIGVGNVSLDCMCSREIVLHCEIPMLFIISNPITSMHWCFAIMRFKTILGQIISGGFALIVNCVAILRTYDCSIGVGTFSSANNKYFGCNTRQF